MLLDETMLRTESQTSTSVVADDVIHIIPEEVSHEDLSAGMTDNLEGIHEADFTGVIQATNGADTSINQEIGYVSIHVTE